jgi:hypothetical protein
MPEVPRFSGFSLDRLGDGYLGWSRDLTWPKWVPLEEGQKDIDWRELRIRPEPSTLVWDSDIRFGIGVAKVPASSLGKKLRIGMRVQARATGRLEPALIGPRGKAKSISLTSEWQDVPAMDLIVEVKKHVEPGKLLGGRVYYRVQYQGNGELFLRFKPTWEIVN